MDDLTKDQKGLVIALYHEFLSRQPALTPDKANYFGSSEDIQANFLPSYDADYVSDICWKLYSLNYIECTPGDDCANDVRITDKVIIFMENTFKRNLKKIKEFANTLIPTLKLFS